MDVTFTITVDDFMEFRKFKNRKRFINSIIWAGIAFTFAFGIGIPHHTPLRIMLSVACVLTLTLDGVAGLVGVPTLTSQWKRKARTYAAKNPAYFFETTVSINAEAFRMKNVGIDASLRWNTIRDIVENKSYIYVVTRSGVAIIIPERAFRSPDESRRFLDLANSYWKTARKGV